MNTLAADYYLAIGGSRHGELLERYGKGHVTIVPIREPLPPLYDPRFDGASRLRFERYELQYFRISKGNRHVAYFVLDTLPLSGALALINNLESEPETLPFQR